MVTGLGTKVKKSFKNTFKDQKELPILLKNPKEGGGSFVPGIIIAELAGELVHYRTIYLPSRKSTDRLRTPLWFLSPLA